ncbi:MAG: hypothetical protein IBX44_03565 [Sulfurospirillum sp.]|nr:hypothetical protein [Sulfurospirillum sp.]
MKTQSAKITQSNFWDTDISVIESSFLPKGKKITDLETFLNDTVAEQGSVLLNRVVNADSIVKPVSTLQKLYHYFFK